MTVIMVFPGQLLEVLTDKLQGRRLNLKLFLS